MSETGLRKELGINSFADEFIMMVAGVVGLGLLVTNLPWLWNKIVTFLVSHHVLVSATHDPLVALPGFSGSGLDRTRLIILLGIVICSCGSLFRLIAVTRGIRKKAKD